MTTVDELQKKLDQTTQELHKTLDDHWMLNAQLLAAKHDLREAQAKLGSVRQSIADALPEEVAHMPLVEGAQTVVAQNAALRAERDRYEAALVARHGGEPVELLRELAAARAEVERLKATTGPCEDSQNEDACGNCSACWEVTKADLLHQRNEARAEVERLTEEMASVVSVAKGYEETNRRLREEVERLTRREATAQALYESASTSLREEGADNERLREALRFECVDVSAERSWCRRCCSEDTSATHGRYSHAHKDSCPLYAGKETP